MARATRPWDTHAAAAAEPRGVADGRTITRTPSGPAGHLGPRRQPDPDQRSKEETTMPQLKLGKRPAKDDSRDLLFARYVEPVKLPTPPPQFGHETLFKPKSWGMLGNDEWGDCAWAGPAHETMLLTKEGGHPAHFTTHGVLSDYAAGTGFDPNA